MLAAIAEGQAVDQWFDWYIVRQGIELARIWADMTDDANQAMVAALADFGSLRAGLSEDELRDVALTGLGARSSVGRLAWLLQLDEHLMQVRDEERGLSHVDVDPHAVDQRRVADVALLRVTVPTDTIVDTNPFEEEPRARSPLETYEVLETGEERLERLGWAT